MKKKTNKKLTLTEDFTRTDGEFELKFSVKNSSGRELDQSRRSFNDLLNSGVGNNSRPGFYIRTLGEQSSWADMDPVGKSGQVSEWRGGVDGVPLLYYQLFSAEATGPCPGTATPG